MKLVEKLEKTAKEIDPWTDSGYVLAFADLREMVAAAAKRIKELEKQPPLRVRDEEWLDP